MAADIDITLLGAGDAVVQASGNQLYLFVAEILHQLRPVYIFGVSVTKLSHLPVAKTIQTPVHRQDQAMLPTTGYGPDLWFCEVVDCRLRVIVECIEEFILSSATWHFDKFWYVHVRCGPGSALALVIGTAGIEIVV